MKAITFLLTLEEPFLATQVNTGEPNSGISYPFVPGSAIRGALVRRYLNGRVLDLATDEKGSALFLSGKVRYLNAYPYIATQFTRLQPIPRSWFVEKGQEDEESATIADFAVQFNHERQTPLANPKSPKGGFATLINAQPVLYSPTYQVTVHNTTGEPGKKKEGVSQMYRYEALASNQLFQGVIVADDTADIDDLESWLDNASFTLGGSSTGGYGLTTISDVELKDNWQEVLPESAVPGYHILTCLSDTIVRNSGGQVTAVMANTLGIDPDSVTAFQDIRVTGGFNQKWGLPLPQAWAIQAGSVFRIAEDAIAQDKLTALTESGIGERTIEGFGRIALNWHTRPNRQRYPKQNVAGPTAAGVTGYGLELAQQMANRRLRQQLEYALQTQVKNCGAFKALPSATQLSRVRLATRHALAQNDLTVITAHMDNLKGARNQWQSATIGGEPLFDWIKATCDENQQKFKEQFAIGGDMPKIAGTPAKLTSKIIVEFNARLIDGVMKLAVEQAKIEKATREGAR